MHFDLSKLKNKTITVIGDVMLDQYVHGAVTRISPEAPVPVVKIKSEDYRIGGAANVAANISALMSKSNNINLFGIIGDDANGKILNKKLSEYSINSKLEIIKNFSTITKLRVLSNNQQLIRLDKEEYFEEKLKLHDYIVQTIIASDVIVLSDYAKGLLKQAQDFIKIAKENNIPVLVDPKGTDWERYKGATILTPNFKEFTEVVGSCKTEQEIEQKSKLLIKKLNINTLVVTRGSKGMLLVTKQNNDFVVLNQHAIAKEVFDVTGAGDTVIASFAVGLALKFNYQNIIQLASKAASIVVSKVGTSVVTQEELNNTEVEVGFFKRQDLLNIINICKNKGEKIVFVNGCFDILHFGHVRFLEKAKQFGDRLIVALNTDESIKKLKGESRPIHNLKQRAEVLSSLQAVDWVTEFNENTPGEIIKYLTPDVLVKTNEVFKKASDLPDSEGYSHTVSTGGEIKIVDIVKDWSTTQIIESN